MSLYDSLPKPSKLSLDRDEMGSSSKSSSVVSTVKRANLNARIPEYGKRKGWNPRTLADFGDGGAFPEIWQHQFPLDMGRDGKKGSGVNSAGEAKTLPIQLDSDGRIKYDVIVKQGSNKDRIIYNKLTDLLPSEILNEDDPSLSKPSMEEVDEVTAKTRAALEALTSSKISSAAPVRAAEKVEPAKYIRYTASNQRDPGGGGISDPISGISDPISGISGGQRIIKMIEVQKDPLEPPKFKINKKIPQAPPSPPAPVLHSPTRKVTVKEQQDWKIPPCISNWKNAKGYTIPLDKRLAADGRGLQQTHINENFAKLSEALYIADRKAREEVEMRAQMEKKIAQKEKEKKEENLRLLAKKAREERAGIRSGLGERSPSKTRRSPSKTRRSSDGTTSDSDSSQDDVEERNEIRRERHRDRQRERNIGRAAPDKRSRLERERDISEQIALGVANPRTNQNEVQFDQRLFNQSKGVASGFGDDDNYDVYDRAWRGDAALAKNLYRPTRGKEDDSIDFDAIKSNNRFLPDKQFSGLHPLPSSTKRDGPVQFEKHVEDDDPFGLDKFLTEAKKASGKRPEAQGSSSSGPDHSNRATYKKSRRD